MKKKLIIPISLISIVALVAVFYVSYGFVSARITNNELSKKQTFMNQKLEIEYSDGTETLTSNNTSFIPGSTITKTFTIKNNGNVKLNFKINLENVTNTFTRKEDITYELYLNERLLISNIYPSTNITIAYNQTLNVNETKNYTLKIIYNNSEENQIIDQGKGITGKLTFGEQKNNLTNLKILGNSIQTGTPSVDTPATIESVGDKTVNMFEYRTPEVGKGTVIEKLPNGAIVKGNDTLFENAENHRWDYGWYTPAVTKTGGNGITLNSGDVVTVSADVTLLEVGLKERSKATKIYLYSRAGDGYLSQKAETLELNNTKRISYTFEINEFRSGTIFYPVFTLNSHKMKIENIQIEKGSTATEYEPYNKYKIPVKIQEINLFDIGTVPDAIPSTSNSNAPKGYYYSKNLINNEWILKSNMGIYGTGATFTSSDIILDKGEYVISAKIKSSVAEICPVNNYRIIIFDKENNSIFNSDYVNLNVREKWIDAKHIFTLNESKIINNYSIQTMGTPENFQWQALEIKDISLRKKSQEYILENIYLDEPLRCIGDICDYIDLEKKKVIRRIYKERITSVFGTTELSATYQRFLSVITKKPYVETTDKISTSAIGYAKSEKFLQHDGTYIELGSYPNRIQSYITSGGAYRIAYTLNDTSIRTTDEAQEKIGDGFDVIYVLDEPIEENIKSPSIYSINPDLEQKINTYIYSPIEKE